MSAAMAVIRLAAARFRGRWSAAVLIALSVAASVVVVGSLQGIQILTQDAATRAALANLDPSERAISIHLAVLDGREEAAADAVARAALAPFDDITEPLMTITEYESPLDPQRLAAVDGAESWATISEGRWPARCAGVAPCEAVRVGPKAVEDGEGDLGSDVTVAGFEFRIVGIATEGPNLPVAVGTPGRLVLLAEGQAGIRDIAALEFLSRTSYWALPIDASAIHTWDLGDLTRRIDALGRQLAPSGPLYQARTPEHAIAAVTALTAVATGRLVFISSLIVAFLLAFAAFAAAIERSDVALEDRRLRRAGASRAARLLLVVVEALLPAGVGLVLGLIGATAAVGQLAATQGVPVDVVIRLALFEPGALAVMALVVLLAVVALVVGIHPGADRLLRPRMILAAVVPAGVLLAWMAATTAGVGAAGSGGAVSPATVVLPAAVGLALIVTSLVLLPPVLRAVARVTRRAPLNIRLAAISLARRPLRPAAVMTLLAFSVGGVAFGQIYTLTLRQGAADQAAFRVGSDLRIDALGVEGLFSTQILPRIRMDFGSEVDVQPMVTLTGTTASRREFSFAGFDGGALDALRGWRRDFSPSDAATLGAAIDLEGAWQLPAQPIADGAREITLDVTADGDPIRLKAIVEEADGRVRYIDLGDLAEGRATMRAPLLSEPEMASFDASQPVGWRILGLLASPGGPAALPGSQNTRQEADVTLRGLDAIVASTTSIHLDVFGSNSPQLIRGAARTDGLIIPAIVSPDLEDDVDPGGVLHARIDSRLDVQLRPVGVASRFPTIFDGGSIVVVDLEPLLLAMNASEPGSGVPNRALLRTAGDERTAEIAQALGSAPFPALTVESRPATEERLANDPFATGLRWALSISGLVALALAVAGIVLAAVTELRDDRGDFWELEAQGVPPRSLLVVVMIRTLAMCIAGALTGIGTGLLLSWVAAAVLGVGADGGMPVPPLRVVAPWAAVMAVPLVLLIGIAIVVFALTRRHFRASSLGGGAR